MIEKGFDTHFTYRISSARIAFFGSNPTTAQSVSCAGFANHFYAIKIRMQMGPNH